MDLLPLLVAVFVTATNTTIFVATNNNPGDEDPDEGGEAHQDLPAPASDPQEQGRGGEEDGQKRRIRGTPVGQGGGGRGGPER